MKYLITLLILLGCSDQNRIETLEERLARPQFQRSVYRGELRAALDYGRPRETLVQVGKRWYIVQAWRREVERYIGQTVAVETRPESRVLYVIDDGWIVLRDG